MEITKTNIEGCFVITPKKIEDERGYFFESFNKKEFDEKTGLNINFVQDNESYSKHNVLRGMHFQKGENAQAKLVSVARGKVYDVAVDLRKDSPTYGKYVGVELDDVSRKQLFIPRGCAHGFYVISENGALFQYKCDNYYCKTAEDGIPWNDKTININWGLYLKGEPLLSEKDLNYNDFSIEY